MDPVNSKTATMSTEGKNVPVEKNATIASSIVSVPNNMATTTTMPALTYSQQMKKWLVNSELGRDPSVTVMQFCAYRGDIARTWKSRDVGINEILLLPGGEIASCDESDNNVRIWRDGECIANYEGHEAPVCSMALMPNGDLVTGSDDHDIKVWREEVCILTLSGHESCVECLCVLDNGDLVSGGDDSVIKIWRDGVCIDTLVGHTESVYSVLTMPSGDIASASWDATIRIWRDGECVQVFEGHQSNCLAFLPNGDLISGSDDRKIKVWSAGECLQTLEGHERSVSSLVVLPNGDLVSAAWDSTLKIWSSGVCVKTIAVGAEVNCMQLVNNNCVVCGFEDGEMKIILL